MRKNANDRKIRELLQMGWLQPYSDVARVICPDLVAKALAEKWTAERFIHEAIPRIAPWIKATQGLRDNHLVDGSAQNFIVNKMMKLRLDLFYDEEKGTWEQYLYGIGRRAVCEAHREDHPKWHAEWKHDRADHRPVDAAALRDRQRKVRLARRLASKRPAEQRQALAKKYGIEAPPPTGDVPRQLTYMRRFHALGAMRQQAAELGFRYTPARHRTRRRHRHSPYGRTFRPDPTSPRLRRRRRNGKLESERMMELDMTAKQAEIDAKNTRALEALFKSLPDSLKDRLDVLAEVREIFAREFAKRLKCASSQSRIGGSGEPSAP